MTYKNGRDGLVMKECLTLHYSWLKMEECLTLHYSWLKMKECLTLHYSWLKNGHYIPFVNTLLPKDMAMLQGYGKIASLLYQENGIRLKPGKIKLDF